jgi:hypothetical protein
MNSTVYRGATSDRSKEEEYNTLLDVVCGVSGVWHLAPSVRRFYVDCVRKGPKSHETINHHPSPFH